MPRRSRKISESGIYHIMLRGNERKNVFGDEEDKERVIETLIMKRNEGGFCIYAYCIMDNHLHLVVKEGNDSVARIVKRIGTSFAIYYNKKHNRLGHVFQDRFKSESITSNSQLLEVIRYTHNNPEKALITNGPAKYKWSSYRHYICETKGNKELQGIYEDFGFILGMYSSDRKIAVNRFKEFNNERIENLFMDIETTDKEQDDRLIKEKIENLLKEKGISIDDIKQNKQQRDDLIREMKYNQGFSIRQISKHTGINRNTIQKVR